MKAFNFTNIEKILVIKLRHIGDVLLTVPVYRALRENFPNAHISALVNSGTEEVLSGNSLINEIIIFDRNIKRLNVIQKYIKELSFLKNIRKKSFDLAVDLTSGDRAAIISFLSGASYRIAHDPNGNGFWGKRYLYTHIAIKERGSQHIVLRNLDVIRQFGIDTENTQVDFFIPEDARMFVKKIFKENNINNLPSPPFDSPLTKEGYRGIKGRQTGVKVIHVHPISRALFKCWKDEYMAEVIRWLVNKRLKVVVTSSPEKHEVEKAKNILSLVDKLTPPDIPPLVREGIGKVIDLCGKTSIKQLAAVAEASDLFLGVDSAPMHIAAAVGTPVIAIMGAGKDSWSPWGKGHVVLFKDAVSRNGISRKERIKRILLQIRPEDVIEEVKRLLFIK